MYFAQTNSVTLKSIYYLYYLPFDVNKGLKCEEGARVVAQHLREKCRAWGKNVVFIASHIIYREPELQDETRRTLVLEDFLLFTDGLCLYGGFFSSSKNNSLKTSSSSECSMADTARAKISPKCFGNFRIFPENKSTKPDDM